jgi:hypothetical protein
VDSSEELTSSFSERNDRMIFTKGVNFFLTEGLISGSVLSAIFSTKVSCDIFSFSAWEAISSRDYNQHQYPVIYNP